MNGIVGLLAAESVTKDNVAVIVLTISSYSTRIDVTICLIFSQFVFL